MEKEAFYRRKEHGILIGENSGELVRRREVMTQDNKERIPVEEAIARIMEAAGRPKETEEVPLLHALGRILAEDVTAVIPQPPFTRSPLDGYALHAADIEGAAPDSPVSLPVVQYIPAGGIAKAKLPAGSAARIMTGAPVPEGADCIIRQEETDEGEKQALFYRSIKAGQNICLQGEDIAAGEVLVPAGTRLSFAHLGLMAGQGIGSIAAFLKVRVAVMATGDELVACGQPLLPGQIYDSNCLMLSARLSEMGAEPVMCPAGPDEPKRLAAMTDQLLKQYPLVITTGGVSVGQKDYMPEVAERLGMRLLFHGIAAKPGSPVLAAERNGHVLLALSGNPFASVATFELLAVPVLAKLAGESQWEALRVTARLKGDFQKGSQMRRYVRARIEGGEVTVPEKGHSSGGIGTLAGCNCLIDIPGGSGPLKAGDEVTVWML